MSDFATRTGGRRRMKRLPTLMLLAVVMLPALGLAQNASVSVPLMLAPDAERQGFVRIINESDEAGTVRITAVDDAGTAANPIEIQLAASQSLHFNSDDLANGNAAKGIGSIGLPRQGHWRLTVETALEDVQVLAFVRTRAGFLTAMHDMLPRDAQGRLVVRMLNPGSNSNQVSKLRLVNTGENAERVSIAGVDDQGSNAGPVTLTLAAGQSRTMSAFDLEEGAQGLTGRLDDGAGKWRLLVTAGQSVVGVGLLETPIGPITNISTAGVPAMAMSPTQPGGQGNSFADAINLAIDGQISGRIDPAGESDYYRIRMSEAGTLTVYTTGDLDTRGFLHDGEERQLASNDDGGANDGGNFRIEHEVDAGTYYVRVEAYYRDVTGSYTLHAEFAASTEPTGDDHGNDITSATNLALGGQQSGRIDPVGDKDYFRIQVTQSGTLTVHTTGGTDTFGRLFDSSGTRLTTNDDGGASTNFRIEREVDAGTYYAEVTEYADNATGSYTVHAEFAATTDPEEPEPGDTFYGSARMDGAEQYLGNEEEGTAIGYTCGPGLTAIRGSTISPSDADAKACRVSPCNSRDSCGIVSRFRSGQCFAYAGRQNAIPGDNQQWKVVSASLSASEMRGTLETLADEVVARCRRLMNEAGLSARCIRPEVGGTSHSIRLYCERGEGRSLVWRDVADEYY